MTTPHLSLPYLVPEQAQKHVTVNDAFRRLDALVQMQVLALNQSTPPATPSEGDAYALATSPSGVWQGEGGKLAFYQDGAWVFIVPQIGWRVYDQGTRSLYIYDQTNWASLNSDALPSGLTLNATEIDHAITSGRYNNTSLIIPDRSLVLGVTARVLTAIGASKTWRLGVSVSSARYGSGIGWQEGSTNVGVSSNPVVYYGNTPIRITATSGNFIAAGVIRLRLYTLAVSLPTP